MSAERFEITLSDDGLIHISGSNGRRASLITPDGIIGYVTHGAIRQQARDLDQLRADLAAAVAERGEYWGALHSTKDDLFECRANQRTLESDLRVTRDQRDTLRARLAAIDGAPTVACVNSLSQTAPNYLIAELLPPQDRPAIGAELIARPAKD